MEQKTIVVGLDGATPNLVMKWIVENRLPNLARIRKDGVGGNLWSTTPPVSPVAWASFMTGLNPGKHGVFDWLQMKRGSRDLYLVNSTSIDGTKLWKILSDADKRVMVINVPFTFPPEKVNGFMISGLATSGLTSQWRRDLTYPSNLYKELIEEIGDYKTETNIPTQFFGFADIDFDEDAFLAEIYSTTDKIAEAMFYLKKKYDWDFLMVAFLGTDTIQHFFWKYTDPENPSYSSEMAMKHRDVILKYYQRLDEIVGELLEGIYESTNVIIMSDHGFGPQYSGVFLNNYLMSLGLLQPKERSWMSRLLLGTGLSREKVYLLFDRLGVGKDILLRIYNTLPQELKDLIPQERTFGIDCDMSATQAYVTGWGELHINVKGRNPEGIVEPGEEYEKLRQHLIEQIYKLKDSKTGNPIFNKISKKEEVYKGPHLPEAPDLVINFEKTAICSRLLPNTSEIAEKGYLASSTKRSGMLCWSGTHRTNGLLLMKGKGIRRGLTLDAKIIDLYPTVLFLMDVVVPSDIDGGVLTEAFYSSHIKSNPIRYEGASQYKSVPSYAFSKKEEEEIHKRLGALGYFD